MTRYSIKRTSNLNGREQVFPAEVLDGSTGKWKVRFWDGKEAVTDWFFKPGDGRLSTRWYDEEVVENV